VVAPPPDLALAATVPAVPPPDPHPATLDLLEHTAETLAKLAPGQISALISASSDRWSECSWRMLTKLEGEQRAAVPRAFYHMMAGKLIERASSEEFAEVPRWLLNAGGTMTDPRAGTIASVATESRRRTRNQKIMIAVVGFAVLFGLFIIFKMAG
jgi:hypothetical protein